MDVVLFHVVKELLIFPLDTVESYLQDVKILKGLGLGSRRWGRWFPPGGGVLFRVGCLVCLGTVC